ncbi:hypothetical protein ACFE04_007361 [Oxalis oulophora]
MTLDEQNTEDNPPPPQPDSPPYSSSVSSPHSSHSQFSSPQLDQLHIHHNSISQPSSQPVLYPLQSSPPHLHGSVDEGGGTENRDKGRGMRPSFSSFNRVKSSEGLMKKVLLVSRVLGFLFCLISFSVMAADKDQGWAIDSFYKYKEFRYCLALNVIGFVYSGLQGLDLVHHLITGKLKSMNSLRYQMDFLIDQTLTYLLLSASSSAAVRADDWELNWGKDKFPQMAKASVVLSFLAFVTFASCSLVSGYNLFTLK